NDPRPRDIICLSQIGVHLTPYVNIHDPLPHDQIKPNIYFVLILLESKPEDLINYRFEANDYPLHPSARNIHHQDKGDVHYWVPVDPWKQPHLHLGSSDRALRMKWYTFDFFPNVRSVDIELRLAHGSKLQTVGSEGKISALTPLLMVGAMQLPRTEPKSLLQCWRFGAMDFASRWFCGNIMARMNELDRLACQLELYASQSSSEVDPDNSSAPDSSTIRRSITSGHYKDPRFRAIALRRGLVKVVQYTTRIVLEDWGLVRE